MSKRNGVPFELKRAEVSTQKTDYYDLILRKTPLRQGTKGFTRHHFCLLKACGNRLLSTKGEYVEILEFSHFARVFKFTGKSNFGRKKEISNEIKVSVVIELV
ncbi:hypothetical protein LAD12857_34730 [Lacrimispora amygdalina]|uniref:Uncharacterized protein n=1 Tax=Lacrimispora amygdalina TaxID=253257 RepID=A0ABQ5MA45_9FIRM